MESEVEKKEAAVAISSIRKVKSYRPNKERIPNAFFV
jgi:hypothetical protein